MLWATVRMSASVTSPRARRFQPGPRSADSERAVMRSSTRASLQKNIERFRSITPATRASASAACSDQYAPEHKPPRMNRSPSPRSDSWSSTAIVSSIRSGR